MTNTKDKPVETIVIRMVKAEIMETETENGKHYRVTFSSLYKDGEEWQESESYGRDDLPILSKVADIAYSKVHELSQENTN